MVNSILTLVVKILFFAFFFVFIYYKNITLLYNKSEINNRLYENDILY